MKYAFASVNGIHENLLAYCAFSFLKKCHQKVKTWVKSVTSVDANYSFFSNNDKKTVLRDQRADGDRFIRKKLLINTTEVTSPVVVKGNRVSIDLPRKHKTSFNFYGI